MPQIELVREAVIDRTVRLGLRGLRRRGYTPQALQLFAERTGVSKSPQWIDYALLEQALRVLPAMLVVMLARRDEYAVGHDAHGHATEA